ncbi:MAG: DUF192 domain-containing protein [Spirochaetaceae bacterium]|nr:DUF192 domain-containing protein [Spirochaetaceae bacterium]
MKRAAYIFLLLSVFISCTTEKRTAELKVGDKIIHVEIADTAESRALGLMHRKSLPRDRGMLFVFEEEKRLSFWMKNTLIPLSIAYISRNGEIKEIHKMYPLDERSVSSSRSVKYALEMNQGWFKENGIVIGDKIIIPENL